MLQEIERSFLAPYGIYFCIEDIKSSAKLHMPFKNHAQFPILTDVLIRKYRHCLALTADFPDMWQPLFLEALISYLSEDHIPHQLRGIDCFYFNEAILNNAQALQDIAQFFCHLLDNREKYIILVLPYLTETCFRPLVTHPKCRIITFKSSYNQLQDDNHFTTLHLTHPSESDKVALLRQRCDELEAYHHVIIPDEILNQAYTLAGRYLNTQQPLEDALLLLDSSAARAKSSDLIDNKQIKPILTMTTLTHVLSGWTQIPATHLHTSKFKLNDFIQQMQEKIFGQEQAITMLGNEIQYAQSTLTPSPTIFGAYLFAGPDHSGKNTCAIALAQQLYQQTHMLYFAQMASATTLANIPLLRHQDEQFILLGDAIKECPYGIFVFEQIEKAPISLLKEIEEIIRTGIQDNGKYHFRHAIIILNTTCGSEVLIKLNKAFIAEAQTQNNDLIQLLMNNKKEASPAFICSPKELLANVMPEITSHLPTALCDMLHFIPFFPLNYLSIEKIMRSKLNALTHLLYSQHGIEFSYASEVIKYLANQAMLPLSKTNKVNEVEYEIETEIILKHLYITIDQAIHNQSFNINKHRPRQLFLQLNEFGTLLRCDWLTEVKQQIT